MEHKVPEIIECLARVEEEGEKNRQLEAEQRKVEAEEQRKRDIEWHQQYVEGQKRKSLEQAAARWLQARQLRMFIRACEVKLLEQGEKPAGPAIGQWLAWARKHADRLDPITQGYLEDLEKTSDEETIDDEVSE